MLGEFFLIAVFKVFTVDFIDEDYVKKFLIIFKFLQKITKN